MDSRPAQAAATTGMSSYEPVANHGAGISADRFLDHPLVVVDEQPRRYPVLAELLLAPVELDRSRDRVAGAAAEISLVVDRRALLTQVDLRRQARQHRCRCRKQVVAVVRK